MVTILRTKTDEKDPSKRQYLNIPEIIQKKVSQVAVRNVTAGFTKTEVAIIRAIYGECLARYNKPVFSADVAFACQINPDYRVIISDMDLVNELEKGARLLVDRGNGNFTIF
jgi:hypothetical protein